VDGWRSSLERGEQSKERVEMSLVFSQNNGFIRYVLKSQVIKAEMGQTEVKPHRIDLT
jgi:hypothetical protein